MESVQFIQWCLDNLNYWTITLLMAIESSFIPFPSEVVVPPAAYKAAATGELSVWLVILFATVGAITGALINYYLALWLGKPIVYKFANSRVGHMCLLDQAKVGTPRTCGTTAHLHPCGTCQNGPRQVRSLSGPGRRSMECRTRCSGMVSGSNRT